MEAIKNISVAGWDFSEYGDNVLLSVNVENITISGNVTASTVRHGSFLSNAFYSNQRVNCSVGFLADSMGQAVDNARLFTDFVMSNIYSNNGDVIRFDIFDRHGYGGFTNIKPIVFDVGLKNGVAIVEFDFTFTHPFFYSNNNKTVEINSNSIDRLFGLRFPTVTPLRFARTVGSVGGGGLLVNAGSVPAPFRLTLPVGGVNPVIMLNDKQLMLEVETDKKIIIDSRVNKILVDNVFVLNLFSFGTTLSDFVLGVGASRVEIQGRTVTGESIPAVLEFSDTYLNI